MSPFGWKSEPGHPSAPTKLQLGCVHEGEVTPARLLGDGSGSPYKHVAWLVAPTSPGLIRHFSLVGFGTVRNVMPAAVVGGGHGGGGGGGSGLGGGASCSDTHALSREKYI